MSTLLLDDTDFLPEFAPEATRCRACEGTGMVQCDPCFLADASCDCCSEPAEVLAREPGESGRGLPLCNACNAEAA